MTLDLNKIRQALEAKRDELQASIAGLSYAHPQPVDAIQANDVPQDNEDIATDFLEMQKEQSILVNQQALLEEVQAALKRLDDGTYGRCEVCGKPIPEKRLEVIPWASRDVEHEQQEEQVNLSREEFYSEETE